MTRRLARASRWLARALVACCSAFLAASAPALHAQAAPSRSEAWRFTWTITPTAAGQPIRTGRQVMDVTIWNGIAQISVREGALRAMTGERGTMLLRASDSTLLVINPIRRDVLSGSLSELAMLMSGPAGAAPFDVADVQSATRDLGAGAPVIRFPTRRVRLTQRYTLRVTTPGVKRELRTEQVATVDVSRDLSRMDPGFSVFAEQFARSLGLPDTVRRVLRSAERSMPVGFPVRSTTVGRTVSGSDTLHTTTVAEMSALRREAVDTADFVAPAGFRVTEVRRLLNRRSP